MLYTPNFCCQCGDEIERVEWKLWTSRRFCENCERDFRYADWLPRVASGLMILGGLFGIGSFLKSPEKPLNVTNNQFVASSASKIQNVRIEPNLNNSKAQNSAVNQAATTNISTFKNQNLATNNAQISTPPSAQTNRQNPAEESVYFCGAQTKKGTPCTRKVKGAGRCWQHTGLPAMLPKEKLAVSQ